MNDAEYEKEKARVEAICDKWHDLLGMGYWEISYIWERDSYDADGGNTPPSRWARTTHAETATAWEYRRASIAFYLRNTVGESDAEIEKTVLHEFAHVLVNEMRDDTPRSRKHEERVVSGLSDVFRWIWEAASPSGVDASGDVLNG